MADVTINNLTGQAPTTSDVFPFSTTGVTPSTYKATLAQIKTGLGLATVATTGSYNDLTNKPSIPSVNNSQLAKAWVNWKGDTFNAQNECTINASYNINKVVRDSNGRYTVFFSTPSPVSNQYYVIQGGAFGTAGAGTRWLTFGSPYLNHTGKSTTSFVCECCFSYVDTQDAAEAWVSVI